MNIIVDTSVFSLVLRRKQTNEKDPLVLSFRTRLEQGDCFFLLGNILQELLDGVTSKSFDNLLKLLKPFPLVPMTRETYVHAAQLRNHLRTKGIQASPIDFLIAAACIENGYPLLTADRDFSHIAKHSDLTLLT